MSRINLDNILNVAKLENELELEEALSLYSRSRVQLKKDPSIKGKKPILQSSFRLMRKSTGLMKVR